MFRLRSCGLFEIWNAAKYRKPGGKQTQVALLSSQIIPSCELLGAVILARLLRNRSYIQEVIVGIANVSSLLCWRDSMVSDSLLDIGREKSIEAIHAASCGRDM